MSSVTISQVTLSGWQGQTTNVELRLYCDTTFTTSDSLLIVSGAPGGSGFYTSYACTVDGTAKTIRIPSSGNITLNSTTDGTSTASARYGAFFFDSSSGALIGVMDNFSAFKLFPTPSPVTWSVILGYNFPVAAVPFDRSTYSSSQIEARIAAVVAGAIPGGGILSLAGGGTGTDATNSIGLLQKPDGGDSALSFLPAVFTGPTSSTKTFTLPNASATIITSATGLTSAPGVNQIPQGNAASGYTMTTAPTFTAVTVSGAATAGSVTTSSQGGIIIGATGGVSGEARINSSDGVAHYTGFKAPALTSDLVYKMPSAQGASDTFLRNDGSGNLNWMAPAGGSTGYNTIQNQGTPRTQRSTLNVVGATALAAADNSGTGTTELSITTSPTNSGTVVGTGRSIAGSGAIQINSGSSATLAADITISAQTAGGTNTLVTTGITLNSSDGTLTGTGALSANRDLSVAANKTVQRLNARANNGSNVTAASAGRPRINYLDGTGFTWTITDSSGSDEITVRGDVTSTSNQHTMIAASTHTDSSNVYIGGESVGLTTVSQGDMIVGNSTPAWVRLKANPNSRILKYDGTDVGWGTVDLAASTNVGSSLLGIANGGSGQATQQAALNALAPATPAAGDILYYDNTNWTRLPRGTNGQLLAVDTTLTGKIKWATVSGSGTVTAVAINDGTGTGAGATYDTGSDTANYTIGDNSTSTPVISVKHTPQPGSANSFDGSAYNQVAYALHPQIGVGQSLFTAGSFTDQILFTALIYQSAKIKFNTMSFGVTTAATAGVGTLTQASQASIGLFSVDGTTQFAKIAPVAVNTTGLKVVTISAGAGGVTIAPGYYLLTFMNCSEKRTTSNGALATIDEVQFGTGSNLSVIVNTNPIFKKSSATVSSSATQPNNFTSPAITLITTGVAATSFPLIKFTFV